MLLVILGDLNMLRGKRLYLRGVLNIWAVHSWFLVFWYSLIYHGTNILRTWDIFRILGSLIHGRWLSLIRLTSMWCISWLLIMVMMVMVIMIFESYFLILKLDHNRLINNYRSSCSWCATTWAWLVMVIIILLLILTMSICCKAWSRICLSLLLMAWGLSSVTYDCFIKLLINVIKKGGIIRISGRRIWMPSTHIN